MQALAILLALGAAGISVPLLLERGRVDGPPWRIQAGQRYLIRAHVEREEDRPRVWFALKEIGAQNLQQIGGKISWEQTWPASFVLGIAPSIGQASGIYITGVYKR